MIKNISYKESIKKIDKWYVDKIEEIYKIYKVENTIDRAIEAKREEYQSMKKAIEIIFDVK